MSRGSQLSSCHMASIMDETNPVSSFMARCSFCGEGCTTIQPLDIPYDIELTLRRWKDGDCTTLDMMNRLRQENIHHFYAVRNRVKPFLEKGDVAKYEYNIETVTWEPKS